MRNARRLALVAAAFAALGILCTAALAVVAVGTGPRDGALVDIGLLAFVIALVLVTLAASARRHEH
jgi:hypothetical protein